MNFFDGLIQRQQALRFEIRVEMYDAEDNLQQVNRDKEVYILPITRKRSVHEGHVTYQVMLYEKSYNRINPIFEGDVEFSTIHTLFREVCAKASGRFVGLVYVSQGRNFEIVNMVS